MRLACVFVVCLGAGCRPATPAPATPAPPADERPTRTAPAEPAPPVASAATEPTEPVWLDDEAAALKAVQDTGRPLLVDFAADWCAPCAQLETVTFADPAVRARLADFVLLRIDVTGQSDADRALQERYGATALPAIRVRAADGTELLRISEYVSPVALLDALAAIE